jgi:hypothetical protein
MQFIQQLLHNADIELHRVLDIRLLTLPIAWQVGCEDPMMS